MRDVGGAVGAGAFAAGTVAGAGVIAVALLRLPQRVPTHFSLDGHPDGWSSRGEALTLVVGLWAASALLSVLVLRVLPGPRRRLLPVAAGAAWFVAVDGAGTVAAALDPSGLLPWWNQVLAVVLPVVVVVVALRARRSYLHPAVGHHRPPVE